MEEPLHPPDDLDEPLPPEPQALLDQFKAYAVWHPRLVQVQMHVLDTIWEPADVAFVVVCGPSGVGKSKLAEVLARRLNPSKQGSNGQGTRMALCSIVPTSTRKGWRSWAKPPLIDTSRWM